MKTLKFLAIFSLVQIEITFYETRNLYMTLYHEDIETRLILRIIIIKERN